ncbi:hypothetical protein BSL78_02708 [Apostichopus japonicus]|uniref:Uncharacterized protein n=1 Tax=Stichopus japonicus TaxID=307972 RepID=A0A2G8LJB3_STIJA|nr:hypothetical protein BSL78_02708 [Apostichopus japonicus]
MTVSTFQARAVFCFDSGCKPMWRPKPNVLYQLNDTNCVIWVESFSWETCEIDGKIVEFKKIQVYAAGNLNPLSKIIPIHVGFYPKLPGERPTIPFINVAAVVDCPRSFVFEKVGEEGCTLVFKAIRRSSRFDCPVPGRFSIIPLRHSLPSQSADVSHSKKRRFNEYTTAVRDGMEDTAASSYDKLVAARLLSHRRRLVMKV